jgi:ribosomal-protein-alanine N-acetyltransferase
MPPPAKSQPLDPRTVSLLWAGPERAGEIAALHGALFDEGWTEAGVLALLENPASTAFIAQIGGTTKITVGFILGQIAADEAEILTIGVAPELQRRGLGRRLVEGLARAAKLAEGKRLFLEVAADNGKAQGLYRALGFTDVGLRKGYYKRKAGPAVDAHILALPL